MLTVDDFDTFFAALNGGHRPFAWQRRLLDALLSTGAWPDGIAAPTGTGKSSVVDVHVFANAMWALGMAPRVPRRLSVVVNRRAIVDQHQLHAAHIQRTLVDPNRPAVVEAVRAALAQLAQPCDATSSPLAVISLRGGQPRTLDPGSSTSTQTRAWLDEPRLCTIICATPEMWGSRLLFRGYGTSLLSRPRAAGLLALDSAVVIDEAHLTRQLVTTASDVSGHAKQGAEKLNVPALQVVSSTATPISHSPTARIVGVEESDVIGFDADPVLQRRLLGSKRLTLVEAPHQPLAGKASAAYVTFIAARALALHGQLRDAGRTGTVGVIVNHVSTAARVADHLRSVQGTSVELWVGRMRPIDLDQMAERHEGIFTAEGCTSLDVLVTTQTAEVGVDLDFPHLVTELAPPSALAQRFGRVNRRGHFDGSSIEVLIPEAMPSKDRPPYSKVDLATGYLWLSDIADAGGDVSPWNLSGPGGVGVPKSKASRLAWSRITPSDAALLADTSVPQFQEADLAFWLRDDLDDSEVGIGLAVRDLPADDSLATALISATLPSDREIVPVTMGQARAALSRALASDEPSHARVFVISADDGMVTPQRDPDPETMGSWLRPGITVVLDADQRLFVFGVVDDTEPGRLSTLPPMTEHGTYRVLTGKEAADLIGLDETEQTDRASALMGAPASVAWSALEDVEDGWAVLQLMTEAVGDETLRQVWSPAQAPVLLTDHCAAVGDRVQLLAQDLGLPTEICQDLRRAGLRHDAGKVDERFQRYVLCNDRPQIPLAKSLPTTPWESRWRRAGVPTGWRHEQLSAALAWAEAHPRDAQSRGLIVRLVGTSHGWGRPFFPHGSSGLTGQSNRAEHHAAAQALFDDDTWETVLSHTRARFGDWGCAYLEALLRAADGTVSGEGH